MSSRSLALVSMISRTKNTTSSALAVLESPMKSMSRYTTLPATSGNLTAHEWMDCTSSCRYSPALSPDSALWVFMISFLRTSTTSSMLRRVTSSSASCSVFARMSRLGDDNARMMSISESCITSGCFTLSSLRRSSTMSLTLLSLWLASSWQKHWHAARTAVGAWLSCVSVTAHSYVTAVLLEAMSAMMILMQRPFWLGSARVALRTSSSTATCRMSPSSATVSRLVSSQSMALAGAWCVSIMKALRRAERSASCCRKASMISGASGIMSSPLGSL
mmetsp:Transcript_21974/g.55328  ORF Transcript_21974/g.55328 Transcript_21974/m.55328 type:complete len:276 (-) Transcript_21974:545-1372(-)